MGGYVKLWRSSLDNGWLKSGPVSIWHFWTWCLLKASYKQHTEMFGSQKVVLEPGQFILTYNMAASEIRVKPHQARRYVSVLKSLENVAVKVTNKYSIITIVNWASYQGDDCENDIQMHGQESVKSQSRVSPLNMKEGKKVRIERVGVHAGAGAFKEKIEIPSWIPIQIWKDWKEFRIRKKAPLTERAVKKTIDELDRLRGSGNDPEAVLEQSIYRGWTGVFALKSDFKRMSQQTRAEKVNASMAVFARREDERQKERERLDREEGRDRPDPNDDVCLLPD